MSKWGLNMTGYWGNIIFWCLLNYYKSHYHPAVHSTMGKQSPHLCPSISDRSIGQLSLETNYLKICLQFRQFSFWPCWSRRNRLYVYENTVNTILVKFNNIVGNIVFLMILTSYKICCTCICLDVRSWLSFCP